MAPPPRPQVFTAARMAPGNIAVTSLNKKSPAKKGGG
jgi:hypothetical protein